MRNWLVHIALLLPFLGFSQFYIGDSTKLSLGPNGTLYTGGNATFNGPLTNAGTITANRDVNFVKNTSVGNLKFVGALDQNLSGDTIDVGDFTLNKTGNLVLLTGQVRTTGNLTVTNGVVQSDDELDMIQAGVVDETGLGYVEGKMIGRLGATPTFTFPMGITGTGKNYLTLTANKPGTFIRVECRVANPSLLFPDSLIEGIAQEVEWLVSVVGTDSVEATLKIDYSGLNSLASFGGNILADIHIPAIAAFSRLDTLHHPLNNLSQFDITTDGPTGLIESNQRVWITNVPKRFSIALIPSASEPVFYVPTAFAPNGFYEDNRVFRPFFVGSTITRIEILIRDTFNQVVYSVDESGSNLDITQYGWNGLLPSGLEAPDGVYFHTIKLTTASGEYFPVDKNNTVLLVR
ncbi:MAG: hypothetical protein ACFHWX_15970 [Bacteroidota bacterium]